MTPATALACALVAVSAGRSDTPAQRVSGWRNLTWGMSKEQATKALGPGINLSPLPTDMRTGRVGYGVTNWPEQIAGSRALVELSFWKGRLIGVALHPLGAMQAEAQMAWTQKVARLLEVKYGPHHQEKDWTTDVVEVSLLEKSPIRIWMLGGTAIRLIVRKSNGQTQLAPSIEYMEYEAAVALLAEEERLKSLEERQEADRL